MADRTELSARTSLLERTEIGGRDELGPFGELGPELWTNFDLVDPTFTDMLDGTWNANNQSGGTDVAILNSILEIGKTYRMSWGINTISAGQLEIATGAPDIPKTTPGTFVEIKVADSTSFFIRSYDTTVSNFQVNSIREVL